MFVVWKLDKKLDHVFIHGISETLEEAKAIFHDSCSDFFNEPNQYIILREQDTRVKVFKKTPTWTSYQKELIEIYGISEY